MNYNFFVYIITNPAKTVLYIGMTNDLERRLIEHYWNKGNPGTFAGKYYCYNLLYEERYQYVNDAIDREKELKKWSRKKKDKLIADANPDWDFLNSQIMEWPPSPITKKA